jgi:predicted nucleic acid-binding protein
MSAKCFVDTNILVYAHDRSSDAKHKRARALIEQLWASGAGVLSTQVLQEVCVNLRQKTNRRLSNEELQDLIRDYLSWEVVVNTPESLFAALTIESRYKVSFWDALIIQAAIHSGADTLFSEDLSHGQKYSSVQVVNPFLTPAR